MFALEDGANRVLLNEMEGAYGKSINKSITLQANNFSKKYSVYCNMTASRRWLHYFIIRSVVVVQESIMLYNY
jgi:hypothetical protein